MTIAGGARRLLPMPIGLLVIALIGSTPSGGQQRQPQQLVRSEDAVVALFSLQTELEVDNKMLRRMEARVEENGKARTEAREKVDRLYAELDELFSRYRAAIHGKAEKNQQSGEGDTVERLQTQIEAKELEVMAAERAEAGVSDEGHKLRQDVRSLKERMTLLSAQIDSLHASLPTQRESVTGIWDVTLLPSGDKGVFALFQAGTIVTGQYVIDGPFQGSLDGTLIDRKLLLHRIDSRLGRSMDFSASLSLDGEVVRGTWDNYDLSNGQARTGSWSGKRRQARGANEGGAPQEEGSPQE